MCECEERAVALEEAFDPERCEVILQEFLGKKGMTVPVLQKVQDEYGYLPRPALEYVSQRLRIPASKVFGVATFYAQFHLQPRGENIIRVCRGTACHVRGVPKVADKLKESLNVEVGETTEDMKFTYEEVACIGACGLAPVMMINDKTFGKLTTDKITDILESF